MKKICQSFGIPIKEELHDFIKENQPNICQISCYKDGKEVYSDE